MGAPWSGFWERNRFIERRSALEAFANSPYTRGAVTGVGVVTAVAGLAELGSLEAIDDFAQELADRFGPVPEPAVNLLYLLRLKDDRLLMSYGHRRKPFGVQARVSADHGKTWSEPLTLSDDGIMTHFQAAVNIDAGTGDDRLNIGRDADDFADFTAPVTLTGGLDLDTLIALANVNNQFAVRPIVSGWELGM